MSSDTQKMYLRGCILLKRFTSHLWHLVARRCPAQGSPLFMDLGSLLLWKLLNTLVKMYANLYFVGKRPNFILVWSIQQLQSTCVINLCTWSKYVMLQTFDCVIWQNTSGPASKGMCCHSYNTFQDNKELYFNCVMQIKIMLSLLYVIVVVVVK